jgi:hypothetical protein
VALVIRHARRMRRIILSSVVYHIFPHYLINGMIFEKKHAIENKMLVSIFSTTFVWKKFSF